MGRFTRSNAGADRGLDTSVRPRRAMVPRPRRDPPPPALDGPPTFSFLVHGTRNPLPTLLCLNPFRRARGDEVLVADAEGDPAITPLVDHVVPGAGPTELACHAWGHVLVFVPAGSLPPEDLVALLSQGAARARWGFFKRRATTSWEAPRIFWDNHLAPRTARWLGARIWYLRRESVASWSRVQPRNVRQLRRLLGPPAHIAVGVEGG